jgi:PAS domain S-box-containing protein
MKSPRGCVKLRTPVVLPEDPPMDLPTFAVHLESATVLYANAAGQEMLGLSGRDDLAGTPLHGVFPGIDFQGACSGLSWLRLPVGSRRHLRWTLVKDPARAGEGLLVLAPASRAELDAAICPVLMRAIEDLAEGAAPADALHGIVKALQQGLQLPLVRLILVEAGRLLEQACVGDDQVAAAARLECASLDGNAPATHPVLRVAREGVPVLVRFDTDAGGAWLAALDGRGVRSVLAVPLRVSKQDFVLELHAEGLDDLGDADVSAFLRHWLEWFHDRLAHGSLLAEHRLAADALAGAATPAFITDAEGTIVWLNRAFTEIYGHPADEALGATPRLIKSGLHGPRYYRALWSALRSGQSWSGETVDRGADGNEVTVHQTISPVWRGGKLTHYLSIHANTTEQARMRRLGERERGVDEISGLMTRAAFEEHVRQALCTAHEAQAPLAWLLCAVSNQYGGMPKLDAEALAHVQGIIGQRLREALDPSAIIGKLEPFDFAVLLRKAPDQAAAIARSIAESIGEPLPLLGGALELRCHTAVVRYPDDGLTVEALRLAADRALAAAQGDAAVFPAEAKFRWLPEGH